MPSNVDNQEGSTIANSTVVIVSVSLRGSLSRPAGDLALEKALLLESEFESVLSYALGIYVTI